MEKVVEEVSNRLGGFDVWVCLFPGAIITIILHTIIDFVYSSISVKLLGNNLFQNVINKLSCIKVYCPSDLASWLGFLLVSYFLGMVLQEMSFFLKQVVYRNGKPEELLLSKSYSVLNEEETQVFSKLFEKQYPEISKKRKKNGKVPSAVIFKSINAELESKDITKKYAKLNMIYNYSFSIACGLLLAVIILAVFLIYYFFNFDVSNLLTLFLLCLIFSGLEIIFIKRAKKYRRYWVRNILYAYKAMCE